MGVDCEIYVPWDVDDRRLADALGALAGLPAEYRVHHPGTHQEYGSNDVVGVDVRPTSCAGMGEIALTAGGGRRMADGESSHHVYLHYGSRWRGRPWMHLSPPSSPFWCAVARRLVDWFGGFAVFQDSGEERGANLHRGRRRCPAGRGGLLGDDGRPWEEYERAAAALRPVTAAELRAARKVAAYAGCYGPDGVTPAPRGDKAAAPLLEPGRRAKGG